MCGILVVHGKTAALDRERCAQALSTLNRRGPDFSYFATYEEGRLFFGQTVLSITGRPESCIEAYHRGRNGEIDVLLNGQLYNFEALEREHGFADGPPNRSGSDTEALARLHARLPVRRVFELVRGMFAYAVYDAALHRVAWARDPIGEKPLFVYEDARLLALSSEIQPLLTLAPDVRIDREVVRDYFSTRHLLTRDRTVFSGVEVVPAGSLHHYDLRSGSRTLVASRPIHRLVDADERTRRSRVGMAELADQLDAVLRATAADLAPGRVEYGAIVSGGVDSSLAASYLGEARRPARNLCLVFPGRDLVSEQVGRLAPRLHAPIEQAVVSPAGFADAMAACYRATCAPLATHSFVSQSILSAWARAEGLKVLVGGDGADELFGGYEAYRALGAAGAGGVPELCPSPYSGLVAGPVRFNRWDPARLREGLRAAWRECLDAYAAIDDPNERVQQATLLCDTVVQLESVGLRCADQMNMAHSVEGRGFYLTEPVVRMALNLPIRAKIDPAAPDGFVLKPLLKRLFERRLGPELLPTKQGFSGYPNEAARLLLDGTDGVGAARDFLEITNPPAAVLDRATEWKLMNVALFLRHFGAFA